MSLEQKISFTKTDHKKLRSLHDSLVDEVYTTLKVMGFETYKNIIYNKGEMDVYCNGVYYECKCNYHPKARAKAYRQIIRAINNKQCKYGYLVTSQGTYDILEDFVC